MERHIQRSYGPYDLVLSYTEWDSETLSDTSSEIREFLRLSPGVPLYAEHTQVMVAVKWGFSLWCRRLGSFAV